MNNIHINEKAFPKCFIKGTFEEELYKNQIKYIKDSKELKEELILLPRENEKNVKTIMYNKKIFYNNNSYLTTINIHPDNLLKGIFTPYEIESRLVKYDDYCLLNDSIVNISSVSRPITFKEEKYYNIGDFDTYEYLLMNSYIKTKHNDKNIYLDSSSLIKTTKNIKKYKNTILIKKKSFIILLEKLDYFQKLLKVKQTSSGSIYILGEIKSILENLNNEFVEISDKNREVNGKKLEIKIKNILC